MTDADADRMPVMPLGATMMARAPIDGGALHAAVASFTRGRVFVLAAGPATADAIVSTAAGLDDAALVALLIALTGALPKRAIGDAFLTARLLRALSGTDPAAVRDAIRAELPSDYLAYGLLTALRDAGLIDGARG